MTVNKKSAFLCLIFTLLMTLLAPAALAELFLEEPPAEWEDQNILRWTIFDVNEGDAMLLECGGESMLVDGGPNPFREKLRDALDERGLRVGIKYMLATHHHDDHIDGIYRLLQYGFLPHEFLHSYNDWTINNEERLGRAVRQAEKNGVPVRRVQAGDSLTLGDAHIQIYQCTEISNTNARSLMLKVTFGSSSILLCADIIGETQRYFLANLPEGTLDCDLIKLPHHAITPTVKEFLDAVSPEAAIATNYQKNLATKSIAQLTSRNLPAFYSGDGTVYAATDGEDWYIYQTRGEF